MENGTKKGEIGLPVGSKRGIILANRFDETFHPYSTWVSLISRGILFIPVTHMFHFVCCAKVCCLYP